MLEKKIEDKLKREVKLRGGLCLKFTSPGTVGVPDRIVLFSGGKLLFVEVKAPGKKLRPIQVKRKKELEGLGFKVLVIDSYKGIEEVFN